MDKTTVVFKNDDSEHKEWKKGEKGYIDGYVRAGDDRPYAVVVIGKRLVLCSPYALEVVQD